MTHLRHLDERGFTLIEILVAMSVTLIGLAGLMTLYATVASGTETAQRSQRAIVLSDRTLEELRGMTVAQMTSTFGDLPINVALPAINDGNGRTYRQRLQIETSPVGSNLVWIRVETSWTDRGAEPDAEGGRYDHMLALEAVRNTTDVM